MNSSEVLEVLNELAEYPPTEKKKVLPTLMKDETFMKVLKYALDPFRTYGIKKVPIGNSPLGCDENFSDITFGILDNLASRRLSGANALGVLKGELEVYNENSRELLRRILTRDLRCGITAKTVNVVAPGTIPVFDCQLAEKYDPERVQNWPVIVQTKVDGYRAMLFIKDDGAQFLSRKGKVFTAVQWLADEIHAIVTSDVFFEPMVIDGELVSTDFAGTGKVRSKGEDREAMFKYFDILSVDEFEHGGSVLPYAHRLGLLNRFTESYRHHHMVTMPYTAVANHEGVMQLYNEARARGDEGVIVKEFKGLWQTKRTRDWMKIKDLCTADVPVVGIKPGTGKYAGMMGALIVDFNGVKVDVGTGFSDAERRDFTPHCGPPGTHQDDIVGAIIEVEYHEVTPDGSMRHPRFVRVREDKDIEDGVGV